MDDIVITTPIEITLHIPSDYYTNGNMIVLSKNKESFYSIFESRSNCKFTLESQEQGCILHFPWLESSKHNYPMAVWFYTVRNCLRLPSLNSWTTPLLISKYLPRVDNLISTPGATNSKQFSLVVGAGRTRGKRPYMEDVDFTFPTIRVNERYSVAVYGVLDGHGGKECAQYCADEIPTKIAALLRNGKSCEESLYTSFIHTDTEFLKVSDNSGSTANILVWDKKFNKLHIANTGDTRAVLSRSGVAFNLSLDKKATDPDEIARISESGGFISNGRVNGILAVTRALGDAHLKSSKSGALVADPEITTYIPSAVQSISNFNKIDMDEFIVIATDGLWDVMSSQEVVTMIRDLMNSKNILISHDTVSDSFTKPVDTIVMELNKIADTVANNAYKKGSQDNITVMIIRIEGLALQLQQDEVTSTNSNITKNTGDEWAEINIDTDTVFQSFSPDIKSVKLSKQTVDAPNIVERKDTVTMKNSSKKSDEDDLMDFLLDDSNF